MSHLKARSILRAPKCVAPPYKNLVATAIGFPGFANPWRNRSMTFSVNALIFPIKFAEFWECEGFMSVRKVGEPSHPIRAESSTTPPRLLQAPLQYELIAQLKEYRRDCTSKMHALARNLKPRVGQLMQGDWLELLEDPANCSVCCFLLQFPHKSAASDL